METAVVKENPAFIVSHEDYNENHDLEVSWFSLRNSKVGDVFDPEWSNCGRAVRHETAKVVYKDETGVAVLFQTEGTTDDPNPEEIEPKVALKWFQFK